MGKNLYISLSITGGTKIIKNKVLSWNLTFLEAVLVWQILVKLNKSSQGFTQKCSNIDESINWYLVHTHDHDVQLLEAEYEWRPIRSSLWFVTWSGISLYLTILIVTVSTFSFCDWPALTFLIICVVMSNKFKLGPLNMG